MLRLVVLDDGFPTPSMEDSAYSNGGINRSRSRSKQGTASSIALYSAWALGQVVALSVVMDGTSARQGVEGVGCDSICF